MKLKNDFFRYLNLILVTILVSGLPFYAYGADKGKIYFSSDKDQLTSPSAKLEASDFSLTDEVFVTVAFEEPLAKFYKMHNYVYDFENAKYDYNYAVRIFVDDDLKARWLYELPPEAFKKQKNLDFALATQSKKLKREFSAVINNWVNIVSDLQPGKHKVKFDVVPLNNELVGEELPVIASGSFTLNMNKNQKAEFVEEGTTDLPFVTMVAPEIEKKIVAASTMDDNEAPARAFITDVNGNWTYVKDDNGNILYRHIIASVLYKERNGKCWIHSAWYMQEHQGYGNFGTMSFSKPAEGYHNYQVPCDVLK